MTLAQINQHLNDLDETEVATTKEQNMTTSTEAIQVELQSVPARLVAQLTAVADSWEPEDIGPTIQPLYPELVSRIDQAGTMDNCDTTYDALIEWLEANGHTAIGYSREIDVECEPGKPWIVELQQPLQG